MAQIDLTGGWLASKYVLIDGEKDNKYGIKSLINPALNIELIIFPICEAKLCFFIFGSN